MHTVVKRDGREEPIDFNKIIKRITDQARGLTHVNPNEVIQKVIQGVYDHVRTSELDTLAAETAAYMSPTHHEYDTLAARIMASNLQKQTRDSFYETMVLLDGQESGHDHFLSLDLAFIKEHEEEIQKELVFERDMTYGFFGFKTLCKGYLGRVGRDQIVERPQHMLMRVSLGIHGMDLKSAFRTYHDMSLKRYTHASPTMFNAGTHRPQCSSCFLLSMVDDSIEGIYETNTRCAKISKNAGGIGVHVHCIRAAGSIIRGTNGISNGLVPMLKVFNSTARYVDQGGGRRKGAFAIYLEPWHADVLEFLALKKATGSEELRARDLFYALWIPDYFMECVEKDKPWHLMCPDECPGLSDAFGKDFVELYQKYAREGKYRKVIPAQSLWRTIVNTQIETGTPYMLYKDHVNRKNNQMNLGTIKSSNLCVAGYTRILTKQGYIPIEALKNKSVEIWNGFEWSEVIVRQTGYNQQLLRVRCSNASQLDCTPEHQFYLAPDNYDTTQPLRVQAKDLAYGDKLIKHELPNPKSNHDRPFVTITSVTPLDGTHDTFCFTEHKRGLGTFEGIVTGQCSEIVEYTNPDEVAVCNLASVSLPAFVDETDAYNHQALFDTVYQMVRNLNRVIDINYYPIDQARNSNLKHRPIGLGVQGLQDVFFKMRFPWESNAARALNRDIFETIYFAACTASNDLAKEEGVYESYHGSPMSQGQFQFDLWGVKPTKYDWTPLRESIKTHGMRNSLLVALMPTASTSQILGNVECFEPLNSNLYTRSTLSGNFFVVNQYLMDDLEQLGLWDRSMKEAIVLGRGSIQDIHKIPQDLRDLYKTVWEIKQKSIIDMAADRGPYVDQSQSMNLFLAKPDMAKVSSLHMYGWKRGLKTGQYYLRSRPGADSLQLTVKEKPLKESFGTLNYHTPVAVEEGQVCYPGCDNCGS